MSLFSTDKSALLSWVLDYYHVEYKPTRLGWQKVRCMNPMGHVHGDRNPSASVNLEHGWFHCFSCGLEGDGYTIMNTLEGWKVNQVNEAFGGEPVTTNESDVWL